MERRRGLGKSIIGNVLIHEGVVGSVSPTNRHESDTGSDHISNQRKENSVSYYSPTDGSG